MVVRQQVTVLEDGRVELTLPEARVGEVIDLTISFERPTIASRRAGSLRGKIHIREDFDDPIPGMEAYS